jgi:hypothetical protein
LEVRVKMVKWVLAGGLAGAVGVLAAGCGSDVQGGCSDYHEIYNKCPGVTIVNDVPTCCKNVSALATAAQCEEKIQAYYDCLLSQPNLCGTAAESACAVQSQEQSACITAYCAANQADPGCQQCV